MDNETTVKCDKRGSLLPKSRFSKNKRRKSGVQDECKSCRAAMFSTKEALESQRRRRRERFEDGKRDKAKLKDPLKSSCRNSLNWAVHKGRIVKPHHRKECGIEGRVTGHHKDYQKPFEVEWLCYVCHGKLRRKIPRLISPPCPMEVGS
jgi:hypothetical protein